MRTHLISLLLLPLFLGMQPQTTSTPAQSSAPSSDSDAQQPETPEEVRAGMEEGIKHILVSQIEAWNHGKLEGFMQGYWHSPDLTFFWGLHHPGMGAHPAPLPPALSGGGQGDGKA